MSIKCYSCRYFEGFIGHGYDKILCVTETDVRQVEYKDTNYCKIMDKV